MEEEIERIINSVGGAVVYAYRMCPRQGWLMFHGILPEQHAEKLQEGRNIHELYKIQRGHHEFVASGIRVDRVEKHGGRVFLYEVKNSHKGYPAARMQMLFYLYKLKLMGMEATGVIEVPREKKRYIVKLTEETKNELREFLLEMWQVINEKFPPVVPSSGLCRWCGYRGLCNV